MNNENKWGMPNQDSILLMGENANYKTAGLQFIVIAVILIMLNPSFLQIRKNSTSILRIDFLKVFLTSCTVVLLTYLLSAMKPSGQVS